MTKQTNKSSSPWQDRHVLIIGVGKSGMAAARALIKAGAEVTIQDNMAEELADPAEIATLRKLHASVIFGEDPSLEGVDTMILSPGVPPTLPFVQEAVNRGVEIIGELELAYRMAPEDSVFLAVTGTNGKTTTVSLLGEILRAAGKEVRVVGNIGVPAVEETTKGKKGTWFVTEVSSFQLETIRDFHPKVAALLNITPDHLDRHKTVETYAQAKGRIFENQVKGDFSVVNFDDKLALSIAARSQGIMVPFSRTEPLMFGAHLEDDRIVILDSDGNAHEICRLSKIRIPGEHNLENVLAAISIAYFAGVGPRAIAKGIGQFSGVEHRMELVDTIQGVRYYNDSKGTNTEAAVKAIGAMEGENNTILIAGGYDKGADYHHLLNAFPGKVRVAILIGKTAVKIKGQAEEAGFADTLIVEDMKQAVKEAARLAEQGDNVLLSPACASWDMYSSYEERGRDFKKCVAALQPRKTAPSAKGTKGSTTADKKKATGGKKTVANKASGTRKPKSK